MRHPIKIIIKIRRPFGYDWVRFWEVGRLLISDESIIRTEAQLCYYIYRMFGEGRFMLLAWQKGHEGFWCYWLGNICENGFIRDISKDKDVEKLQKDFTKAKSYEEKEDIEEEIGFFRELGREEKKYKRRGPIGLTKSRVGQLNSYEEI